MAKKKIPVVDLKTGMFVAGLDVSWLKTPFIMHSLLITSDLQIMALKNCGAKVITIDTEKGSRPDSSRRSKENENLSAEKKCKQTSLRDELETAKQIKNSTKKAIQNLYNLIQEDKVVKAEMLSPMVDQAIDSLSRNSNAIINLFHSRDQAVKLYHHAFNVMGMSLLIAQQLGYSPQQQKKIYPADAPIRA